MNTLPNSGKALALGLAVGLSIFQGAVAAELKVGSSFPDLKSFNLTGDVPSNTGQVLLIDLWASWCIPCKKSFPVLEELHKKYGSRGFKVVAISADEEKADLDKFLKKMPVTFTILHDQKGKVPENVGAAGFPTSFIVGVDGKVKAIHQGFDGESTRKKYMEEIEAQLKEAGK